MHFHPVDHCLIDWARHTYRLAPHTGFVPFARNIVADVTRDGGYPPLLINPVDFAALRRQKAETAQAPASA